MGIFQKHLAAPIKIDDLTQLAGRARGSLNVLNPRAQEWELYNYNIMPERL